MVFKNQLIRSDNILEGFSVSIDLYIYIHMHMYTHIYTHIIYVIKLYIVYNKYIIKLFTILI